MANITETTPMKAIVFKPEAPAAFAVFARLSDEMAIEVAKTDLEVGAYIAKVITPRLADAEAVFDYINLESKACASMNPGDVIVWEDGRRELCLSIGWAKI